MRLDDTTPWRSDGKCLNLPLAAPSWNGDESGNEDATSFRMSRGKGTIVERGRVGE
jgi:hypothetical protein